MDQQAVEIPMGHRSTAIIIIGLAAGLLAAIAVMVRLRRRRALIEDQTTSASPPSGRVFEPIVLPPGSRVRRAEQGTLGEERILDEVVAGLERVPPLPRAVHVILRELDATGSCAGSVGEIVASEPVIGAALLRVVNSAALGVRRRILTVSQAVAYLGFASVRAVVMRLKLAQLMPGPARGDVEGLCYDGEALWLHSLAVAQVADHLAKRTKKADPDLASTLGLLHDIGKLAINSQFPEKVAELWEPAEDAAADESWLARERRIFGADHAAIGAFLAGRWKLPKELADAIRLHHIPRDGGLWGIDPMMRSAIQVVHIANQVVKYRHVYCQDMEIDIIDPAILLELGLPAELEQIFDERLDRVIEQATAMAGGSGPVEGRPMMRVTA
jgi:putative nucleotidyltransferase with HDIG domain